MFISNNTLVLLHPCRIWRWELWLMLCPNQSHLALNQEVLLWPPFETRKFLPLPPQSSTKFPGFSDPNPIWESVSGFLWNHWNGPVLFCPVISPLAMLSHLQSLRGKLNASHTSQTRYFLGMYVLWMMWQLELFKTQQNLEALLNICLSNSVIWSSEVVQPTKSFWMPWQQPC